MTKNNNKPQKNTSRHDRISPVIVLPQVLANFLKLIQPRLTVLFENIDDTLFNLAEKADSNQSQTLYFESMRMVRTKKSTVILNFEKLLKQTFSSFENGEFDYFEKQKNYNSDTKTLNLELVDEAELDEVLARSNLIHKSEMAYHRQIFAFEKRFSEVMGTEIDKTQIPLSPFCLVNTFSECLSIFDKDSMDMKIKLIIYKLFERTIMGHLTETYTQINDFLADKGIVPDIKYNVNTKNESVIRKKERTVHKQPDFTNSPPSSAPLRTSADSSKTFTGAIGGSDQHEDSAELYGQVDKNYLLISQLFQQNRYNKGTVPIAWDNYKSSGIDIETILMALSALQSEMFEKYIKNEQIEQQPDNIKKELLDKLHHLNSETRHQNVLDYDEETIDLIGMLFQFMVEDKDIPSKIQVLLVKLQIPFLKIALRDRKLFADKNHYARVLLDKLSEASIGWSEESDKDGLFIDYIQKVILNILKLKRYSKQQFKTIQDEFDEFMEKQNKKSNIAQKRIQEKELGKEKIRLAKSKVASLMAEKMTNKQIPILVRDVLLNEWSNVLVLLTLRHKEDSEHYTNKVKFVDTLIEFSQKGNENEAEQINELLSSYRKGLKLVAFNHNDLEDKTQLLNECLNKIGKSLPDEDSEPISNSESLEDLKSEEHENDRVVTEIREKNQAQPVHEEETHEDCKDEYSKIVANLKVGTWMEFQRPEQSSVRAKLSWISPLSGKYLFVNSRGLKITDKSHLALAAGLRDKSIRILNKTAIFDRALSAIAGKLRKTMA